MSFALHLQAITKNFPNPIYSFTWVAQSNTSVTPISNSSMILSSLGGKMANCSIFLKLYLHSENFPGAMSHSIGLGGEERRREARRQFQGPPRKRERGSLGARARA